MNKSEKLKSKRKIKFKCFLLASILTLFFAVAPNVFAADLPADEEGNSLNPGLENVGSSPFSKLVKLLSNQKQNLDGQKDNFLDKKETAINRKQSQNEVIGQSDEPKSFLFFALSSVKGFVVDSPKQYLGTVFESVKSFIFPGKNQNNFEYKSPNNKENAKEIEKLKQQYEETIDETSALSQKFSLFQSELEKIKNSGVVVRQPVIEQKVVERTIERIVDILPRSAGAGSSLSQSDLDSKISDIRTELSNLNTNLTNQINNLSASTNRQTAATYQTISLTNKIDSLSGTRLTNITVNGVSGLTDSDIPDDIIASNYLPLTGGTLSGNLGIGTSSPYAKLSVVGPVVAEYFYATSTTATSTFAGRLLATKAPTLPHTFSVWDTDTANSNVLDSSFLINPSSAVADSNLFGIAVGGNVKFLVDAEGDVFVRNLTATGTVNQANTNISTLTVENATNLGDADTDALTIHSGIWSLTSTATSTVAMTNGLNFDSNTFVIDPNSNRVGIGTTSPYAKLSVVGETVSSYFTATSTTATSTFAGGMNVAGTSGLTVLQNGKVGVGTISPKTNLEINGSASSTLFYLPLTTSSATGIIFKGGTRFIHDFNPPDNGTVDPEGNNLFVGLNSGNFTMGSTASEIDEASYNTGVGQNALTNNTTGAYNTGLGYNVFANNTTGADNTGLGYNTLTNNTTGIRNTGLGSKAFTNNTTGAYNTGLGYGAIYNNTTGQQNTGIGYLTLYNNTSATNTTAIGSNAAYGDVGYSNQGGVYLGYRSGYNAQTNSDYNTLLGYQAGYGVTTGSNNIWLGSATSSSGIANLTTGSQNILIGNNISLPSASASGQLNIGNLIYGTNITGTGSTLSSGNIGIGTTSPYAKLSVVGETVSTYFTATSTTATSTFAGGMNVAGSSGLTVLQNGNVGVGTISPRSRLSFGPIPPSNDTADQIRLYDDGAADWYSIGTGITVPELRLTAGNNGYLSFFTGISGGTEKVRINTAGNVGIGNSSPTYKLDVAGLGHFTGLVDAPNFTATSTTATSTFAGGLSAGGINADGSSGLTVLQNGNGIVFGHTAPIISADHGGVTPSTPRVQILGTNRAGSTLMIGSYASGGSYNNNAPGPGLTFFKSNSGNYGVTGAALNSGDFLGEILWKGSDGTDVKSNAASIYAEVDGTPGTGDMPGRLIFATTLDGEELPTERMRINNAGKVGIGTSTPDSKLTVFASADDSAIEFSSASGPTYKWTMGLDYSDAGKFKIASSTALGSIDRFTIDGNGYVGIGTSTPARRLDVADSGTNIPQLRLSRESNIYTDFSVAQTTGDLALSLYGANANDVSLLMPDGSTGANLWVCEGAACPSVTLSDGGNIVVERDIKYPTSGRMKRSIILTAAGAITPATGGAAKTQVDGSNHSYYVLDFDASSDEVAYWQWAMPDSYDNGAVDITYYWEAGATSGDTILCFQSKGISANNAEDIDSTLSSAVCSTDTAQANANDLASVAETSATSNFTAGEYVTFKVFRDADAGGDTMTGDARLVKVKIEYGVATESD